MLLRPSGITVLFTQDDLKKSEVGKLISLFPPSFFLSEKRMKCLPSYILRYLCGCFIQGGDETLALKAIVAALPCPPHTKM